MHRPSEPAFYQGAKVEHSLTLVFSAALGTNAHAAVVLMEAVISLEVRLTMANTVLARAIDDPEVKLIWSKLFNRIRAKYKKRHEIAHSSLVKIQSPQGSTARLVPFLKLSSPDKLIGLDAQQIRERAASFKDLGSGPINLA